MIIQDITFYILGGKLMKVVVIKSPKFLAGILRMIFKIKKEEF